MRLPDLPAFFIVGAPRCGTTAMSKYLRAHPLVCFSRPKETNYFVTGKPTDSPATAREKFLKAFFAPVDGDAQIYGEGSVSTLYSRDALERILACFPQAKFIVMLRNPVDQLRSYHGRLLYLRQETETDFETAWDLQEARSAGHNVPRSCFDARMLQYGEVGSLGRYTAQLFDVVGRDRCLPILYDDFSSDTAGAYRKALDFLGLPDCGRTSFNRKNQQRQFKSALIQNIYSGAVLGPVGRRLAKHPRHLAKFSRMTRRFRNVLMRSNAVETRLPPLDSRMAARLQAYFADDIRGLSELLQRDLSHWLAAPNLADDRHSTQEQHQAHS